MTVTDQDVAAVQECQLSDELYWGAFLGILGGGGRRFFCWAIVCDGFEGTTFWG